MESSSQQIYKKLYKNPEVNRSYNTSGINNHQKMFKVLQESKKKFQIRYLVMDSGQS